MNQEWIEEFDNEFVKDNGQFVEPSFKDPNGSVGRIKQFIQSQIDQAVARERELLIGKMLKGRENLLSGYCKCCNHKPCDHSTTGCSWEYKEFDKAVGIFDDLINQIREDRKEQDESKNN